MEKIEKVVVKLENFEREALGVISGIVCDSKMRCDECPMNISKFIELSRSTCLSRICTDILVEDNVK